MNLAYRDIRHNLFRFIAWLRGIATARKAGFAITERCAGALPQSLRVPALILR